MMKQSWMEVRERAWLEVKGPDSVRFLNGQVTNNLAVDLRSKVLPACLCSLKGKVTALVWITAGDSPESLILECEASQKDDILARLDRYLIADQCELSEWTAPAPLFHIISPVEEYPGGRECWRLGVKGFDLAPSSFSPDRGGMPRLDATEVAFLTALHAIPESGKEITGESFPSELYLDRWAVDFHKGCYLGQEVISRIKSVGSTKRSLALYSTPSRHLEGESFFDEKGKEQLRVTRDSINDPIEPGRYLTLVFGQAVLPQKEWITRNFELPPKI